MLSAGSGGKSERYFIVLNWASENGFSLETRACPETWVLNFAEYAAYKEYAKRMRTARLAWWTRRAELTSEVLALLDENGKTRAEAESPELLASLGTSRRQLVAACEQFREELERSEEVPASEWPAISR